MQLVFLKNYFKIHLKSQDPGHISNKNMVTLRKGRPRNPVIHPLSPSPFPIHIFLFLPLQIFLPYPHLPLPLLQLSLPPPAPVQARAPGARPCAGCHSAQVQKRRSSKELRAVGAAGGERGGGSSHGRRQEVSRCGGSPETRASRGGELPCPILLLHTCVVLLFLLDLLNVASICFTCFRSFKKCYKCFIRILQSKI